MYPHGFGRTIREVHGEAGNAWLEKLPELIRECERHWGLRVRGPAGRLSYNYVALAERIDGSQAVLKLGVPNPELSSEIAALWLFDGRGAVKLLDCDVERGILLLEYVQPGTPLANMEDDEQATAIAAGVLRRLWRPAPREHTFPTVAKWAKGLGRLRAHFDGGTGPLPERLVERAEGYFAELLQVPEETILLHGDFHHDNVLTGEREPWLVIDPKGLVGERAYELGAFLYNPLPDFPKRPDLCQALERRIDQLCEALGLERERVIGYGLAQAVLSAWWSIEDHGYGWEGVMRVAEELENL